MKIASADARCYRAPLPAPWDSAMHRITHHELIIARLAAGSGAVHTRHLDGTE
jgi:hypothetical protein